ncbi:MAG: MATE family efflux transporter [Ruminococcaceae bacterium]|nr:MATE family efflux transporter [Oscillospiraceae bacterium]
MTSGSILRHLILFSIPLLAGNLFQQLYNMVDTWVVGNFVSNEAFSAVGSITPIINTMISLFLGFASGAGVVISQYYGAKQYDGVKKAVHTSVLTSVFLGITLSLIGLFLIPYLLRLMNTPAEVIPESTMYLRIYFAGLLGLTIYNMGAGILRAVGDSVRPFYYLVVCALLNTVLDLLFVIKFGMGVKGVALATVLSQFVSAVLVVFALFRSESSIKLNLNLMKIDKSLLAKISKLGFPTALQLGITAFSNVFVQGYINAFGADCMSGYTAYNKIDQLIILPLHSLAIASTTFVGQNLGASDISRAKKGVNIALFLSMISSLALMVPVVLFAPQVVAFFNAKAQVVTFGTQFLRTFTPFFLFACVNQIYMGALRGAGNSRTPMFITLGSFVLFRQIYLFVMSNYIINEPIPVAFGYPMGWIVCTIIATICYRRYDFMKSKII